MSNLLLSEWPWWGYFVWSGAIVLGLEILNTIAQTVPRTVLGEQAKIPVRGKPLERFESRDYLFIWFNKLVTCVFAYNVVQYCDYASLLGKIVFVSNELNFWNGIFSVVLCFISYDLPYYLFHRALHLPILYGYVHKHHHRQMAPSRANYDAINVHPFEMLVGEYLHLGAIAFVAHFLVPMHVYAVVLFLGIGGILASLNHTRYPVHANSLLYDVRAHDQHHAQPRCNYSQYTMFWDIVFDTFQQNPSIKVAF